MDWQLFWKLLMIKILLVACSIKKKKKKASAEMGDDLLFKGKLNQFYTSKSVYKSCRAPLHMWEEGLWSCLRLRGELCKFWSTAWSDVTWGDVTGVWRRRSLKVKCIRAELERGELMQTSVTSRLREAALPAMNRTRLNSLWEICIVGNVGNTGAKKRCKLWLCCVNHLLTVYH